MSNYAKIVDGKLVAPKNVLELATIEGKFFAVRKQADGGIFPVFSYPQAVDPKKQKFFELYTEVEDLKNCLKNLNLKDEYEIWKVKDAQMIFEMKKIDPTICVIMDKTTAADGTISWLEVPDIYPSN